MKFVRSNGSQLCNRLWSYAPLVGYSQMFNENVFILDFNGYSKLFPNLKTITKVHFINCNLTTYCCKVYSYIKFKLKGEDVRKTNFTRRIGGLFINGWEWRSSADLITSNRDCILELFSPTELVVSKCNNIINELKEDNVTIVGVHVRKGDYKTFMDGKYCFSDEVYLKIMFQIQFIIENINNKVKFIITSNEILKWDIQGLDYFQVSGSTSIEDLYLLSLCDYIIGPPSTFSMWASFYGQVPLKLILSTNKIQSINEFKIINAVDVFEDGSLFSTEEI